MTYRVELDEETHAYTVDGHPKPSVSAIMRPLNEYAGIPKDVLEAAAKRGSYVHKAIELMLQGKLDWSSVDARLLPYLKAADKFLVETGGEVTDLELPVYNPRLHYCGTIDVVMHIRERNHAQRYIVDWKTTAQLMRTVAVQTAGYQNAYTQFAEKKARRAAVQLKPDGSYKFEQYTNRKDLEAFKACLVVYNWKHRA